MRKDGVTFPKSSFLGMVKDTSLIMNKILSNKNLLKLIYYTTADWEKQPDLNGEEIKSLLSNKQISNVPKIEVDAEKMNYIRISFDDFTPNATNDFYRDSMVEIKIICHFEDWDLGDFELRPYRIAGEIDAMLNGQHLTGIGELTFIGANQDIYDNEYGGLTLRYLAIRGTEDEVNPLV